MSSDAAPPGSDATAAQVEPPRKKTVQIASDTADDEGQTPRDTAAEAAPVAEARPKRHKAVARQQTLAEEAMEDAKAKQDSYSTVYGEKHGEKQPPNDTVAEEGARPMTKKKSRLKKLPTLVDEALEDEKAAKMSADKLAHAPSAPSAGEFTTTVTVAAKWLKKAKHDGENHISEAHSVDLTLKRLLSNLKQFLVTGARGNSASSVKHRQAKVDLLKEIGNARTVLEDCLRTTRNSHEKLRDVFGDATRLARLQAIMDVLEGCQLVQADQFFKETVSKLQTECTSAAHIVADMKIGSDIASIRVRERLALEKLIQDELGEAAHGMYTHYSDHIREKDVGGKLRAQMHEHGAMLMELVCEQWKQVVLNEKLLRQWYLTNGGDVLDLCGVIFGSWKETWNKKRKKEATWEAIDTDECALRRTKSQEALEVMQEDADVAALQDRMRQRKESLALIGRAISSRPPSEDREDFAAFFHRVKIDAALGAMDGQSLHQVGAWRPTDEELEKQIKLLRRVPKGFYSSDNQGVSSVVSPPSPPISAAVSASSPVTEPAMTGAEAVELMRRETLVEFKNIETLRRATEQQALEVFCSATESVAPTLAPQFAIISPFATIPEETQPPAGNQRRGSGVSTETSEGSEGTAPKEGMKGRARAMTMVVRKPTADERSESPTSSSSDEIDEFRRSSRFEDWIFREHNGCKRALDSLERAQLAELDAAMGDKHEGLYHTRGRLPKDALCDLSRLDESPSPGGTVVGANSFNTERAEESPDCEVSEGLCVVVSIVCAQGLRHSPLVVDSTFCTVEVLTSTSSGVDGKGTITTRCRNDPSLLRTVTANKRCKTWTRHGTSSPFWGERHVIGPWIYGESLEFAVWDEGNHGASCVQQGRVVLASGRFYPHGFEGALDLGRGATLRVCVAVSNDAGETTRVAVPAKLGQGDGGWHTLYAGAGAANGSVLVAGSPRQTVDAVVPSLSAALRLESLASGQGLQCAVPGAKRAEAQGSDVKEDNDEDYWRTAEIPGVKDEGTQTVIFPHGVNVPKSFATPKTNSLVGSPVKAAERSRGELLNAARPKAKVKAKVRKESVPMVTKMEEEEEEVGGVQDEDEDEGAKRADAKAVARAPEARGARKPRANVQEAKGADAEAVAPVPEARGAANRFANEDKLTEVPASELAGGNRSVATGPLVLLRKPVPNEKKAMHEKQMAEVRSEHVRRANDELSALKAKQQELSSQSKLIRQDELDNTWRPHDLPTPVTTRVDNARGDRAVSARVSPASRVARLQEKVRGLEKELRSATQRLAAVSDEKNVPSTVRSSNATNSSPSTSPVHRSPPKSARTYDASQDASQGHVNRAALGTRTRHGWAGKPTSRSLARFGAGLPAEKVSAGMMTSSPNGQSGFSASSTLGATTATSLGSRSMSTPRSVKSPSRPGISPQVGSPQQFSPTLREAIGDAMRVAASEMGERLENRFGSQPVQCGIRQQQS